MDENVYLLLTDPNDSFGDIIYSRDTDLKVRVHNLAKTHFTANLNEIQLYGYYNKTLLAFESIDITAEDAMDIILAIKWYAEYLGCPDMEILPDDPRQNHEVAV
jgi:hypothetical protein